MSDEGHRQVVILGGGAAGLRVARSLRARMTPRERNEIAVTLVSRGDYSTLASLLPGVVSSTVAPRHAALPLRPALTGVRFVRAEVEAIDPHAKRISLSGAPFGDEPGHVIAYDEVVLALGAATRPPAPALALGRVGDAMRVRNRALDALEAADAHDSPRRRAALATFVVVGLGPAGCATAGELRELLHRTSPLYPRVVAGEARVLLVGPEADCLPDLAPPVRRRARGQLVAAGVELHAGTSVVAVAPDHVVVRREGGGDERVDTQVIVWATGHTLAAPLTPLARGGRVAVDTSAASVDFAGVWAVGACAGDEGEAETRRRASLVAINLLAKLRGESTRRVARPAVGRALPLGHRRGVVEIFGVTFAGFFAWWCWRLFCLGDMPGYARRLRVTLDWALDLVLPEGAVPVRFEGEGKGPPPPAIETGHAPDNLDPHSTPPTPPLRTPSPSATSSLRATPPAIAPPAALHSSSHARARNASTTLASSTEPGAWVEGDTIEEDEH